MAAMTLVVIATRDIIPLAVPRRRGTPDARATAALAAVLLVLGASFFIADGMQTIAAGALRGLNDTRMPLLFCRDLLLAGRLHRRLWLGFPLGSARPASGSACRSGSCVYALLLVWRFHALTQRGYLPAVAPPNDRRIVIDACALHMHAA